MPIRKAVVLAGGTGTRLLPVTRATNKHLLPLYDRPVIYHAIDKLVAAGIDRIMVIVNAHQVAEFVAALGSGQYWISKRTAKQIQITYGIQNKASGIVDALYIAKDYIGEEPCVLYLGDNIIEDDIAPYIGAFAGGATVFLKEVEDPERFGIATVDEKGSVTSIEEKPEQPRSNLAVVGLYLYDASVFDKMIGQQPSARGEYEITYINELYRKEGALRAVRLHAPWFDIGTHDALLEASLYMRDKNS